MVHLPTMVWVAGFEPATSCFQGRDSAQTELHPEVLFFGSLRLQLPTPRPLSDYPQGTNPEVPAYPLKPVEAALQSRDMTALFNQVAVPGCDTTTRCFIYRLSCRTAKACEPPCDATSKTFGLGPWVSLNFIRR